MSYLSVVLAPATIAIFLFDLNPLLKSSLTPDGAVNIIVIKSCSKPLTIVTVVLATVFSKVFITSEAPFSIATT